MSITSRARAISKTCTVFHDAVRLVDAVKESDDAYFKPALRQWHDNFYIAHMQRGHKECTEVIGCELYTSLRNGREVQSSYQAVAMALLHKRHVVYDPVITIVQLLSQFSWIDRFVPYKLT